MDKVTGKWVEVDSPEPKILGFGTGRASIPPVRVDGKSVHLNRIRLPRDPKIIDRRFEKNPG